jgi:O-antigen biosynthesis protein
MCPVMDDPATLPLIAPADRRIAQLETALCRRNEQLDAAHAALTALHASHAFRLAQLIAKVGNRILPLHSRRRRAVRGLLRSTVRGIQRLTGRNMANIAERGEGTTVALDQAEYCRWIKSHAPTDRELQRQRTTKLGRQPLISIIVPVYNPPERFLAEMIASVRSQTYLNWELCIANGGTDAAARSVIVREGDSQIRVTHLDDNRGIAGNTNAALALATGDYVAFLDHDDVLAPHALFSVAEAINRHPDADFFYSDEDKLDEGGQRVDPCFKPGWSPDLLRHHNYICHLVILKRSLLNQIGGVRPGFDGAQDYDLVLRAGEAAKQIVHIPQVLYHWRLHAQSTAQNTSSKQYLIDAGRRAIEEHLKRTGSTARVTPAETPGEYRVSYQLPRQPLVSILIPNRDQAQMLGRCVQSLSRSSYANYEVLILENGSTQDDTLAYYRQLEHTAPVRVLNWSHPFNFAAINNYGAIHAKGELLLFLNNDVEAIHPDWLEAMVTHAMRPEIGAVGAKLLFADGTIQHAGVVLGMGGVAGHVHLRFPRQADGYLGRLRQVQNVAAVTGACLMTPREVFERVGGFDERFVLAYNDVDYGMNVRAMGLRVLWTPAAELYHLESTTRGYEDDPAKQERFRREFDLFRRKWAQELEAGDPYFNPNFRLDRADCALRA